MCDACVEADQGQNGRVISPGYTEDPAGSSSSQREEQPSAHIIGDNVQVFDVCGLSLLT